MKLFSRLPSHVGQGTMGLITERTRRNGRVKLMKYREKRGERMHEYARARTRTQQCEFVLALLPPHCYELATSLPV